MKKQGKTNLIRYFIDKITGTFTGFLVGMWATGIVTHFFETRSIRNLWGLTARKTLVSKHTFGILEWIASALVGYFVFEIVVRVVKNYVSPRLSTLRFAIFRWIIRNGWHWKIKSLLQRGENFTRHA
jgi:hypothetical protein